MAKWIRSGSMVQSERITKQTVVPSKITSLLDPLGLVASVSTKAKIILQQFCKLKLDWDTVVSQETHTEWILFRERFAALDHLQLRRQICLCDYAKVRLYVFADGSQDVFGAAVYIRPLDGNHRIIMQLLYAKSEVAPVKKLTTQGWSPVVRN